ncbi:hypothetical protein N3C_2868 [Clostridium sp. N3C]|uniref:hypothetical protein n=1 Tax=Clostridium sp. N3C TaxID=1776758 RepID=UPI00092DEE0B|nr:hypothetical protein [Clostridium sp. N3C]SCN26519.1 hypothetical protein N3C_2868 [Clostridium sp. N3C]
MKKKKRVFSYLLSIFLLVNLFPNIKVSAEGIPALAPKNLTLSVSGTRSGNDGISFTLGDTIQLSVGMDNPEKFDSVEIYYLEPETRDLVHYYLNYNEDTNQFEASINIEQYIFINGKYEVLCLDFWGKEFTFYEVYNSVVTNSDDVNK